jgi:hypothetical protein
MKFNIAKKKKIHYASLHNKRVVERIKTPPQKIMFNYKKKNSHVARKNTRAFKHVYLNFYINFYIY